ncbi:ATP synthase subunit d, mitochondrial [Capsicum annuum]|nr:ATP synthase subunit d, mitochondrial [Capsicum annuum]
MSGTVKKIADVTFKAGKTIDWEGMAKLLVTDEARKEFSNLRRAFDDVNSQLQTKFSQEPEPINWEYYRKGIGSRLVDMYKEAYESIEIPKFEDTVTPQYKPKFDALLLRKGLDYTRRNRNWVVALGALGVTVYGAYRAYCSPSMVRKSERFLKLIGAFVSLAEMVSDSADVIGIVSKDLKEFIASDSDEIPRGSGFASVIVGSFARNFVLAFSSGKKGNAIEHSDIEYSVPGWIDLVELKEAEKQSLKESERLEKEVAEVQELKIENMCLTIKASAIPVVPLRRVLNSLHYSVLVKCSSPFTALKLDVDALVFSFLLHIEGIS